MHHILGISCFAIAWTIACLWVGKRWGVAITDDMKEELEHLRGRLAVKIAGQGRTLTSNPYKKGA